MEFETNDTVMEMPGNPEVKAPENMVLGIVGAVMGALIGGASIIGLSQMGYIASISGLILAFCTLKGYELLAKGLSTKGVILCAVLMLLTPFVADYLDWAIMIYRELGSYGFTFGECLQLIPEFLKDGTITMGEYLKNLGMIYLFVIMGGFYTLKNAFKK